MHRIRGQAALIRAPAAWPLSRRSLRLTSGLVLFAYLALHLANDSLGLVSLGVAEQGLRWTLGIWHSGPGSVLVTGQRSFMSRSHSRRSCAAQAPRRVLDSFRVILGIGIPTLLIGHAVGTRVAWELYAQSPQYARVVWSLWSAADQGRQLALLVPGWMHGCLGIHLAFSGRDWYRRLRWALVPAALLLPMLGALGFLEMGRELANNAALRQQLDAGLVLPHSGAAALRVLRDSLLALYLVAIAAAFVARGVRLTFERRLLER